MSSSEVYDQIGCGYTRGRREEPRIAAALAAAIGDAGSVLNVGAGTGSYEPRDRPVVAVEPSAVMVAQRAADAAPAVRATAEALPFAASFGAAMAVLSIHHWSDKAQGLAEMRRVARGPVVLFGGSDRMLNTTWWLHDYFPAARRLVAGRTYPPERIAKVLGSVAAIPVPIPADCADGFEAAYWRRPQAILDPAIWRATSALSLISDTEGASGMSRLSADLDSGDWERRYGHLLGLGELDLGYRVIVASRQAG
jgi:SAM-dependent methyltransferase